MINIKKYDIIIIGSGFCGSVIARMLAETGKKVLLLERREHIAGNMYDEIDENGILVQRYGPHIFHTNNKEVYEFITKYDEWFDFHHAPAVELEGKITPAPSNFTTIDVLYDKVEADIIKSKLKEYYKEKETVTIFELLECDELIIKAFAEKLYELNYKPYTAKQWGIAPEKVDPNTLKRVPIRLNYNTGYFDDTYQCMPKNGYTQFFNKLLEHENIEIHLNTDALGLLKLDIQSKKLFFENEQITVPVIYTGAIDELLDYQYGQLPYRSLKFEYKTENIESYQDASVVAYPFAKGYTRITEYKKLPPQNIKNITTIMFEYPLQADKDKRIEPYYPIISNENLSLYQKYLKDCNELPNLFLCGRLADYKYYNMDIAIIRAFEVFDNIKK